MQISPQKFSDCFIRFVFMLAILVTCPSASRLKQQPTEPAHVLAPGRCIDQKAEGKDMNRLSGRKDKQMATSPEFCPRQTPPASTNVRRPG